MTFKWIVHFDLDFEVAEGPIEGFVAMHRCRLLVHSHRAHYVKGTQRMNLKHDSLIFVFLTPAHGLPHLDMYAAKQMDFVFIVSLRFFPDMRCAKGLP